MVVVVVVVLLLFLAVIDDYDTHTLEHNDRHTHTHTHWSTMIHCWNYKVGLTMVMVNVADEHADENEPFGFLFVSILQ